MVQVKKRKKKHQYDLRAMEDDIIGAYNKFKEDDCEETRTQLFITIRDLAAAILAVSKYYQKMKLDFEVTSYEYGLYMFERLVLGAFIPGPELSEGIKAPWPFPKEYRFPWQHYIRQNLKHVIFTMQQDLNWQSSIKDVEFLIDKSELDEPSLDDLPSNEPPLDETLGRRVLGRQIIQILELYYSRDEIKRLLPISLEYIYQNKRYFISPKAPPDIKDFSIILVSTAKRLVMEHGIRDHISNDKIFKDAMTSSTRSTIFLSTVVNSDFFPKEFLLTLDIDSLYRLCGIMGGQTVKIPTLRELDTLLGVVVTVSKIIMDEKNSEKALKEAKENFKLVFSNHINMNNFVSKVLESHELFKDEETEPIISILASSIKSMDKLFNDKPDGVNLEEFEQYSKLCRSFKDMLESIVALNKPGVAV